MALDHLVPPAYTHLARLSTWLLLVGLLFLPTAHIHRYPRPVDEPTSSSPGSSVPSGIPLDLPYDGPAPGQITREHSPVFQIMVLPPLSCFLGTAGVLLLFLLRRTDYRWLSTVLVLPSLTASLASLALVFYLVYKDGSATWSLMEAVTAILAGVYSAMLLVASIVLGRRCRFEDERRDAEIGLEEARDGAPQIPEMERVASLKEELLPEVRCHS
jgi:hypothetical protein